jgi:hypothetical protein
MNTRWKRKKEEENLSQSRAKWCLYTHCYTVQYAEPQLNNRRVETRLVWTAAGYRRHQTEKAKYVGLKVLTGATLFGDIEPCSSAEVHRRSRRTYCLHFRGLKASQATRMRQAVSRPPGLHLTTFDTRVLLCSVLSSWSLITWIIFLHWRWRQ